jgi:glycosyltransferase involved in cell wall biosynthesis
VRVLAALPGLFPSTVINVARPLMQLAAAGALDLDVSLHFATTRRQIARADVLVMSHTISPAHEWILDCAHEHGTPLLYDLDENLLDPPGDVPGLEFHREPARRALVQRAISQAVLVRTYAPALQRLLAGRHANVVRVDGPVDWRLVPEQRPDRHDERVHVVYATSRVREDSIGHLIVDPLARVLREHDNVDVTIWGPELTGLERHPRVRHRGFVSDYSQYFAQFARAGFDVGLAPMPDHAFYQCKTATKFREYAACRIAGVYSDVEIYRDCVTDGVTGLLVPSQTAAGDLAAAWAAAIGRLVAGRALRARIQDEAEARARERYSAGRLGDEWLRQLDEVRATGPRPAVPARVAPPPPAGQRAGERGRFVRAWTGGRRRMKEMRQLLAWKLALRRLP